MDTHDLQETAHLLAKNWGLTFPKGPSMEDLRVALRFRLQELLEDNFGGLVNAMYRLDISEPLFKSALDAGTPTEIADRLTDLVLDREFQRLATRRQYRNQDGNSPT